MNTEIKLAILSHESAQPTVDEFMPYWLAITEDVEVFVPEGHKGGTPIGPNAYKGKECLRRFAMTCDYLVEYTDADLVILAEYDVLPLVPVLPKICTGRVSCPAVALLDHETNQPLHSQICALPPWIATRPMLAALSTACKIQAAKPIPDWTLGGLLDRIVGAAMINAGMLINHLDECLPHCHTQPDAHKHCAATGKTWVHGWKSLDEIKPLI